MIKEHIVWYVETYIKIINLKQTTYKNLHDKHYNKFDFFLYLF